jgi:Protein of unknown function (DUF2853)
MPGGQGLPQECLPGGDMSRYLEDVRRYDDRPDLAAVKGLERYLASAMRSPDSRFVATTDARELSTIRDKFLKRKLKLKDGNQKLDALVGEVAHQMKAQRMKRRLTFYYLCAKRANKLSVFS